MKMTDIVNLKRKDLLSLPNKQWSEIKTYESIIIVPTTHKHDSGWRLMAIIGCNKVDNKYNVPVEIAGYCDDINFILPKEEGGYNSFPTKSYSYIHSDMLLSNCIRFWSNYHDFRIGGCCSSTEIEIIYNKHKYDNE